MISRNWFGSSIILKIGYEVNTFDNFRLMTSSIRTIRGNVGFEISIVYEYTISYTCFRYLKLTEILSDPCADIDEAYRPYSY